jgi:predicted metal-binding protein
MEQVIPLNKNNLIIDYRARDWCKLPYPDHPKGCPNYGIKSICPPTAPLINEFIDLNKNIWLVVVDFNLREHMNRMKKKHPHWSDRQTRCVLYWQPRVNKQLKYLCKRYSDGVENSVFTTCPEAMGINVIQTVKNIGVPICIRPKDIIFKVGLIGHFVGTIL